MMMWYFPSIFYRLHGLVLSLHSWVDDRQKVGRKSSILLPRNVCDARSATNATTHPWKIRNHSKNLTLQIPKSQFLNFQVMVKKAQNREKKTYRLVPNFSFHFKHILMWSDFERGARKMTKFYSHFSKAIWSIFQFDGFLWQKFGGKFCIKIISLIFPLFFA